MARAWIVLRPAAGWGGLPMPVSIGGDYGVLRVHRSLHLAKGGRHAIARPFPEATSRRDFHSLRRSAGTGRRPRRHTLAPVPHGPLPPPPSHPAPPTPHSPPPPHPPPAP